MIKKFIKRNIYILILLLLSLISHLYIFTDLKILNWGDWVFYFNSQSKMVANFILYLSSFNLGSTSAFTNNWIFYLFFYLINHIGISWDTFTRLFFLIPIVFLTPLFSFLLFKKIFKSDLIAFFSACIYSFNTFFLKLQLDWITYAFIWWILPALFLNILNYLETNKNKFLIYNALLVFLGFVYELRVMIIVLVFLFFFQIVYLIFDNRVLKIKIKSSFYILISFFLGILGHAFWLIPLKFGNIFGEVMSSASSSPFVSFYGILDAFTLHMYSWSHNLVLEPFIKQPIEWRYFLIPIIAMFGLSFCINNQKKIRKYLLIFFLISLPVCLFLGKQELEPWPGVYGWLFHNLPLFNLFRESGKFFIFIAISLSFFFGLGLYFLYGFVKRFSKILAIVLVIMILFFSSIFNLQHFIDQKIGGMTKGIMINDDYIKLEKILSSDPNYYRILWMPTKPRFGFYSEQHPFINAVDLTTIFKDRVSFNFFDQRWPVYSQLLLLLTQDYSDRLLDNMDVKYVILPVVEQRLKKTSPKETQTVNEIYENYGEREYFSESLDMLSYLEKIDIGTKDLVVYENKNYKPHLYQTQERESINKNVPFEKSDFKVINPTQYQITLKNIKQPIYFNFSEAYNQNWKLRIGDFSWFKVLTNKNYFLSDEYHFKNEANLNSFFLNLEYIKKNFPEQYKENPDGSIDLDMVLYFRPQSYFYLGLIISGAVLIGCLGFLIYYWRKKKTARCHPEAEPKDLII